MNAELERQVEALESRVTELESWKRVTQALIDGPPLKEPSQQKIQTESPKDQLA